MNYQDRYLKHQAKKKRQLTLSEGVKYKPLAKNPTVADVLSFRRSQRVFNGEPISDSDFQKILESATTAPNSCNRHGIKMKVVTERKDKELLGGILVGGIGWIHRADKIVLFFGDIIAYASPNEKDFMHYCDVGFTAMPMWLTAETLGIGVSYINPNVVHKDILQEKFAGDTLVFCGALVFGHYDTRATKADPGDLKDMML